jgi:carboxymethylenebutenolidase
MYENEVIVTARYGQCPSFVACPDGPGPYPGIIFYMDAPGIRDELRNMTRRIAREGYFAILPDMYYRLGCLRFDFHRRNDDMAAVYLAAMRSLTNAMVMEDTAGILGWLDAQEKCRPGPVGCVGYCMSGQHITNAAAIFPHRIKAAASLYGWASSPTRTILPICGSIRSKASSITPLPSMTAVCRHTSPAISKSCWQRPASNTR